LISKKNFATKRWKKKTKNFHFLSQKNKEGASRFIIPVVGKGLWGPIWGYICLEEDMNTIAGVSFDHKTETPGLGAEINKPFFMDRWKKSEISDTDGNFQKYEVVKDNSGTTDPSKVDGITGGTITSKGVEEMVNRSLAIYTNYFKTRKSK
jgi:Na+-transporting NADH:ubiquinone oxidoreductase subunit C